MSVFNIDTKDINLAVEKVRAGDEVYLSGTIYTARDAAHKRIAELIKSKSPLPFELKNAVIYYSGPTPARPGSVIGSCGPTTSSRMDVFTPILLENGLSAMIGKGPRSEAVTDAIKTHKALYFCAVGGAGALAAMSVKSVEVVAFEELGCESVKRLTVEKFPLICAIDAYGGNLFKKSKDKNG